MTPEWPTDPDDPVDPALAPLIEAGEGESEGFEEAEGELIEHARHDDQHGSEPDHAGTRRASTSSRSLDVDYGESDEEEKEDG